MKKKLFIVILASTILLSACSSGQQAETTPSIEETTTTTVTTTEATTTTTEATTTTVSIIDNAKPEDYAAIRYVSYDDDDNYSEKAFASDFEFVNAELVKDVDNNMIIYPNYQAGKSIVVRFKCDKQFKYGSILRYASSKEYDESLNKMDYSTANISKIELGDKGYTSTISKYLKYSNGVYTLTIPSKYVKADNRFVIQLYTKGKPDEDGYMTLGDEMIFFVRCEKESLPIKPSFTREQHASLANGVEATDIDFGNAKFIVKNDGHIFYAGYPEYPTGQDIVVTFKSYYELSMSSLNMLNYNIADSFKDIKDPNYVTCVNGTYTVTIPAEYAKPGNIFMVYLQSKSGMPFSYIVCCE